MGMCLKAISRTTRPMAKVCIGIRVDKLMREIGLTICNMVWAQKYLKMDQSTQGNSETDKNMGLVRMHGRMERTIKVSGTII